MSKSERQYQKVAHYLKRFKIILAITNNSHYHTHPPHQAYTQPPNLLIHMMKAKSSELPDQYYKSNHAFLALNVIFDALKSAVHGLAVVGKQLQILLDFGLTVAALPHHILQLSNEALLAGSGQT